MKYQVQCPQETFSFSKDEFIAWYKKEFPWADDFDVYQLCELKSGEIKYLGRGIALCGISDEQKPARASNNCIHDKVYHNIVSANLSFFVCKNCKQEVSEAEAKRRGL